MIKKVKLILAVIVVLSFINCFNNKSSSQEEFENLMTINYQKFDTINKHLFIYKEDNELDIILSNNIIYYWCSYKTEIQLLKFYLKKTDVKSTYTFLEKLKTNLNYSFTLAGIKTIKNDQLNTAIHTIVV